MKAFINPISSTYPPTIEIVESVYGQRFEGTDENIKKLHFNQAIDEIDVLTNQNNTPIRDYYEKLSTQKKDYAIKALARLYAYFVIINQTYVKGNLEASQGDTNINYQFQYPKNIDPQVYNLLQMAGLYQQTKTINLGNNENWTNYNNPYHDEHTYEKMMKMEPISKSDAWKAFVGWHKITSKDNSVLLNWTYDRINGVYLDLSAQGDAPTPIVFGDSLKKINDKWEVVFLKNLDGTKQFAYSTFVEVFSNYVLGANVTSKSPDLVINKQKFGRGYALEFDLKNHQEAFGSTLKNVNDKWEVVGAVDQENPLKIIKFHEFFAKVNYFLDDRNFQQVIGAFKKNVVSFNYHTDGEFSFHYWQNPSLITTYKKPDAYSYTVLFGINQNPTITNWSPYIEYDFNANTGEVDFRLASFKKTGAGWDKKLYLIIKTDETNTILDFKKNPATFIFNNKTYDVQSVFDKALEPHNNRDVIFSKVVLDWKRTNPNIVESGNSIEVHNLDTIIRSTKWVGSTFQFHFDYCAGNESSLHGIIKKDGKDFNTRYAVYRMVFIADKLPALNTSTWTKVYKMDYQLQWILGNKGELKYEEFEDCSEGAPTVELKLEISGYYLRFVFNGFKRWWNGETINFQQHSLWDRFKIVADVYNK